MFLGALRAKALHSNTRSAAALAIRKRGAWSRMGIGARRFTTVLMLFIIIASSVCIWFVNNSQAGVSRYGIYSNTDSLSPGLLKSTINTPAQLEEAGEAFRLLVGMDNTGFATVITPLGLVDAKGERTCGMGTNQKAYCWGNGYQNIPTEINMTGALTGKTVAAISNGDVHTCVLATDRLIYCWGSNIYGQLGNNSTNYAAEPVAVDMTGVLAGKTITALSTGIHHTCAIASDNLAYCWGRNQNGQLGNNSIINSPVPVPVDVTGVMAGKLIHKISSGFTHTCAVDSLGQSYCWGANNAGQLGNNSTLQSTIPVATYTSGVLLGKTIKAITAYGDGTSAHTCSIASDDLAYCWGHNANGRLGNGLTANSSVPVAVSTAGALSGKTILKINVGLRHTCAVASDLRAYCWGYNTYGQTASGQGAVPGAVNTSGVLAGKDIVDIAGGARHTCVVDTAGQSYCWGYGLNGNMGNGTYSSSGAPVATNAITYIPAEIDDFVLQYTQRTAVTCSAQPDDYQNVTDSTPIAYNANPSVADRTELTTVSGSFTPNEGVTPQQYVSSGTTPFTNTKDIPTPRIGAWDFSLKDNGSPINTSYCLRIAYSDGTPLASYSAFPEVSSAANNNDTPYRFYDAANSIAPGQPIAAANTAATLTNPKDSFRVRMGVGLGAAANAVNYKLQYAQLAAATCNEQATGFNDVTTGTAIAYQAVSEVADRTAIATTELDPITVSESSPQTLVSSGNALVTNPAEILVGRTGLWDFSLRDNTSQFQDSTTYCLRITLSDGSELGVGTAVAQLTTAERPALTSAAYRFYQNANASIPGPALAAQNTDATLATRNDAFRLRTGIELQANTYTNVAAGESFTCALVSNGKVSCWGANWYGMLGNNSYDDSYVPVSVDSSGVLAGKTASAVVAGTYHACALTTEGRAYCWGDNSYGQLGDNSTNGSSVPVAVDMSGALAGKSILSISAGYYHTCFVASDSQAYCWGSNSIGQLGDSSNNSSYVPIAVDTTGVLAGKMVITVVAGLYHTCAATTDGNAYCWGNNGNGQLGNNSTVNVTAPVAVDMTGVLSGKSVRSLAPGHYHTCAITTDGRGYCWGNNNMGQLGNGANTQSLIPVAVSMTGALSGKTLRSLTVRYRETCGIATDNQSYCWGSNIYGQLGNNSTADSNVPVAVNTNGALAGKAITNISVGYYHACVTTNENRVHCWGDNEYGKFGNDSTTSSLVPTAVSQKMYGIQQAAYTYKLQYAQRSAATCSVQNTGFADITNSTPIAFNQNSNVSHDSVFVPSAGDPAGTAATGQSYISSGTPFTARTFTPANSAALFDFSLKDNGAPVGTTYCLRLVFGDGNVLGLAVNFPSITTGSARYMEPSVVSIVTDNDRPVIRGTYDSNYVTTLRVRIGQQGRWYTLGIDPELTAVGDNWTLSLSGATTGLRLSTYDVQVEATTVDGVVLVDRSSNELAVINKATLADTGMDIRIWLAIAGGLIALPLVIGTMLKLRRHRARVDL